MSNEIQEKAASAAQFFLRLMIRMNDAMENMSVESFEAEFKDYSRSSRLQAMVPMINAIDMCITKSNKGRNKNLDRELLRKLIMIEDTEAVFELSDGKNRLTLSFIEEPTVSCSHFKFSVIRPNAKSTRP